jgi:spermidine/putrescine transport system permease protein
MGSPGRGGKGTPGQSNFCSLARRGALEVFPTMGKNRFALAWTGLIVAFLYAPIAVMVVYSFNASRLNLQWAGFTLRWYGELMTDRPLLAALENSLLVAVAATLASVVLGTAGAWLLHRYRYAGAAAIATVVAAPIAMPEVLMGVSLLVFFVSLGWKLGFGTLIVSHTTFCFPFVLLAVQSRLHGLDPALEEAALDLGATPARAFWSVILPSLRPAVVAGGLLAFALSMDELIVSFFTAGPNSTTIPLKIFGLARVGLNPKVNALSALFVVVTVALVFAADRLRRLAR